MVENEMYFYIVNLFNGRFSCGIHYNNNFKEIRDKYKDKYISVDKPIHIFSIPKGKFLNVYYKFNVLMNRYLDPENDVFHCRYYVIYYIFLYCCSFYDKSLDRTIKKKFKKKWMTTLNYNNRFKRPANNDRNKNKNLLIQVKLDYGHHGIELDCDREYNYKNQIDDAITNKKVDVVNTITLY
jgi:hypothetical protein